MSHCADYNPLLTPERVTLLDSLLITEEDKG